jgi:hypothetical protein
LSHLCYLQVLHQAIGHSPLVWQFKYLVLHGFAQIAVYQDNLMASLGQNHSQIGDSHGFAIHGVGTAEQNAAVFLVYFGKTQIGPQGAIGLTDQCFGSFMGYQFIFSFAVFLSHVYPP